jgi:hypothetical protein
MAIRWLGEGCMGLFDKLFNDDDKKSEEEAKRKAAEKYAEDHARERENENGHARGHEHEGQAASHAHAAAAAAPAKKASAKKAAAEPKAATKAAPKSEAAAKPAAKKVATKSSAVIPHQHGPLAGIIHQGQALAGAVTVAHDQAMTLHVLAHIPDHAPREDDPHYHLFEQAKARLKRQGLWKCIINDDLCGGEPELHHTFIEFSQINEVDPKKIQQALGLHFQNDEEFQTWAESPGNLEVLCSQHHRAHFGIHVIPGPLWEALRFRRAGTAAAAEFVPASESKDAD